MFFLKILKKKNNDNAKFQNGIVLSFDDDMLRTWYNSSIEIQKEYPEFKATFFITRLATKTENDIILIKKLKSMGHEIGNHSFEHIKDVDYLELHGADGYMNMLNNCILSWKKIGINCISHAYPFGSFNNLTNQISSSVFKNIRGTGGSNTTLHEFGNPEIHFFGASGIDDYKSGLPLKKWEITERELKLLCQKGGILMTYGHYISDNSDRGLTTTIACIKQILDFARQNNLKIYTFAEACELIRTNLN